MTPKQKAALIAFLDWLEDGRRSRDIPREKQGIYKFAERCGYVTSTRIKSGFIVNPTGRRP